MAEVYLRRLSRWQAEQQRDAVADVYVSAYRSAAGAEHRDRQGFLTRLEQHVQHTGFDMVVADTAGTVGCAYGFQVPRTGEWWSRFQGELPADVEELTASGRTFLLAELMVLPAHRRQGVATRLVERLLIRLEANLIVAATSAATGRSGDAEDGGDSGPRSAAAETFRAWGWSRSGVSTDGPGQVPQEVWLRRPQR
ncbi:GNAT family N-acetyltransferase [Streptomyces sp. CWNU-52B]|uniref:GNAT family N-acetyltransferase n=1 Tax=unclassified Streptomyces TaxID=2593676 RepID=UPI0039C38392